MTDYIKEFDLPNHVPLLNKNDIGCLLHIKVTFLEPNPFINRKMINSNENFLKHEFSNCFIGYDNALWTKNNQKLSCLIHDNWRIFDNDEFGLVFMNVYIYHLLNVNFEVYSILQSKDVNTFGYNTFPCNLEISFKTLNKQFNQLCYECRHKPKPEIIMKSLEDLSFGGFKFFFLNWSFHI